MTNALQSQFPSVFASPNEAEEKLPTFDDENEEQEDQKAEMSRESTPEKPQKMTRKTRPHSEPIPHSGTHNLLEEPKSEKPKKVTQNAKAAKGSPKPGTKNVIICLTVSGDAESAAQQSPLDFNKLLKAITKYIAKFVKVGREGARICKDTEVKKKIVHVTDELEDLIPLITNSGRKFFKNPTDSLERQNLVHYLKSASDLIITLLGLLPELKKYDTSELDSKRYSNYL